MRRLLISLALAAVMQSASAYPSPGHVYTYGFGLGSHRSSSSSRSQTSQVDSSAQRPGSKDNAGLSLDVREMVELLSDPHMSPEGKIALENDILAEGLEAVPELVAVASEAPQKSVLPNTRDLRPTAVHLLYRLLLPRLEYGEPAPLNLVAVKDWQAWWSKRARQPLENLQDEMDAKLRIAQKTGKAQTLP
ncbi:MAG: hypothetical protein U1E65_15430 [Myxococcota bacterium]